MVAMIYDTMQGRIQDFKKVSLKLVKFLNKFPALSYLGYFTYQLTKYQFFQIIIVILLLLLLLLLLPLFLLKSWSVVGLWGFRIH